MQSLNDTFRTLEAAELTRIYSIYLSYNWFMGLFIKAVAS